MTATRLLTAAATAALIAGACGAAWAQTPQTAQTQAQAQAATGKPTTDAPANTAVQGTASAVKQGVAGAPAAAPAAAPAFRPVTPAGDLIQTLVASGQFTTLIKALDATNLTPVLKNQPHLTVFAPTDAAFAAYMPTAQLMADLPGLQKLLLHHIINAEVDTSKFKDAHGPVNDGAGNHIVLDGTTPTFKADQANILQADVRASNGLIDVVDQVLKQGSVPEAAPVAAEPAPAAAEPPAPAPAKKKGTKKGG
ncbi:MAG: fasciclin domain-containing protein [Phenylobacterium sp.]|nr:MAG: fasciclin domain-containing protein [Phenylobacterium sp.]